MSDNGSGPPPGVDSAQLAAMQHGQSQTQGQAILGFFHDTQGVLGDMPGLFGAQMGGILGKPPQNKLLADLGIRTTFEDAGIQDHTGGMTQADPSSVYGHAMVSASDGGGGGGADSGGTFSVRQLGEVLWENGVRIAAFAEIHMSGGLQAPAIGKGMGRQSDYGLAV